MIVTLTLNPCVDRTVFPDGTYAEQSGGKGVNVARVLRRLGMDCKAVAPVGAGIAGERFQRLALDEGVPLLGVPVKPDTRRIDTRYSPRTGEREVDYRAGEDASEGEISTLRETLEKALSGARLLMVCGSAPGPNLSAFAAEAIRMARATGAETFLDSSGEALRIGYSAEPGMVKINRDECMQLIGRDIPQGGEGEAAESLLMGNTRNAILTLGGRGAVWAREGGTIYCPAPKIEAVNEVGSGDCFAAALIWALFRGFSDSGALAAACAAGAANARVFPAARIGREDIESILGYTTPDTERTGI